MHRILYLCLAFFYIRQRLDWWGIRFYSLQWNNDEWWCPWPTSLEVLGEIGNRKWHKHSIQMSTGCYSSFWQNEFQMMFWGKGDKFQQKIISQWLWFCLYGKKLNFQKTTHAIIWSFKQREKNLDGFMPWCYPSGNFRRRGRRRPKLLGQSSSDPSRPSTLRRLWVPRFCNWILVFMRNLTWLDELGAKKGKKIMGNVNPMTFFHSDNEFFIHMWMVHFVQRSELILLTLISWSW